MKDTIVIYFEGNGTAISDFIDGKLFKIALISKDFEFFHLETPLTVAVDSNEKRIMLEDSALQENCILDFMIKNIYLFSKSYKNVVLLGMSLGACNIAAILDRLYSYRSSIDKKSEKYEIFDTLSTKKLSIITMNCDIFFPKKESELMNTYDFEAKKKSTTNVYKKNLMNWSGGDYYYSWLPESGKKSDIDQRGFFSWVSKTMKWFHIYLPFCDYNFPVFMERYENYITFLKVDDLIIDFHNDFANHNPFMLTNIKIFSVIRKLIRHCVDKGTPEFVETIKELSDNAKQHMADLKQKDSRVSFNDIKKNNNL